VRQRTVAFFAVLALVALLRFVVVFAWIFDGIPYSLVHLSSRATQAVRLAAFLYCFSFH
jgi:flagellar biogenesis protein FliO